MARKKIIKADDPGVEFRYASWLKMLIDLIQPKSMFTPLGRGSAKTTDILAERSMDIIYDMPGAPFALVGDTYANLQKNVVKALFEGWQRKGWVEGVHYVVDKPPPSHFEQSHANILSYKHIITIFNGCTFTLVSMDRPSSAAGNSYMHIFGDEAKYLKKEKIFKLFPAIRGDYRNSPFYRGMTFTSDMPNPWLNEDTWMLDMEKEMDKKQIKQILDTAFILNDIKKEIYFAKQSKNEKAVLLAEKNYDRWDKRWRKVRKNSIFFYIASSYINADILSAEYFVDALISLGIEEYKVAILSMKAEMEKGAMFYGGLRDKHHFYYDGTNYKRTDQLGLLDNFTPTSADLNYIQHNRALDCGVDFGNMNSMIIGQRQGNTERALKFLYTLTPEWLDELAEQFLDFFAGHKSKVLHMYYDRAGNNYNKAGQDLASELKNAIERRDGKPTKWTVILKSKNQRNITQVEEFNLVTHMLAETNPKLPHLQIDAYNCEPIKASLSMAPLTKDSRGRLKKDKKSEKLPLKRLPLESTNPSDAFKYWICKREYLRVVKGQGSGLTATAGVEG